ncbi:MAG: SIR2 family protein [Bacteroidetes bacterium]|nr:SIR2 family protein [Bacteroidota bacterium]
MNALDVKYVTPKEDRKLWCEKDDHILYERYVEFNEWFDSDEGIDKRAEYGIENLSQPSKALFAGDFGAYNVELTSFRNSVKQEILSKEFIEELTGDDHWYMNNVKRFGQLIGVIMEGKTVPFVGAGISSQIGFPTWKQHLIEQGKTSGIKATQLTKLLDGGQYEKLIEEIEVKGFRDAFLRQIKDTFSEEVEPNDTYRLITDLFPNKVLTTNYDQTLEQAYKIFKSSKIQIIESSNILENLDYTRTTVIKLHGDINYPPKCIISKKQYEDAYGNGSLDLSKDIPSLLKYYFETKSLLFLGCSLNRDRTMEVFKEIKDANPNEVFSHFTFEAMPETKKELEARNNYLAGIGIAAIWYPKGRYEYIEQMLRLALNELRYRGY